MMAFNAAKPAMTDTEKPMSNHDPIVDEILRDTIKRGERAFGWIRIWAAALSLAQVWLLFGPSWLARDRLMILSAILAGTILATVLVGAWLKVAGPTKALLISSLALDRLAIYTSLLCLMAWPAQAYPGLGRIPEIGFVFIITVAAGLRLNARLAIAAAVSDLVIMGALLRLDRMVHGDRISTTLANEVMVLLILSLCGGLAWAISSRSASLVARGAKEAREAEQVRTRLGAYVSTELLDLVLDESSETLGGRRQTVVVLFCDLRGFTSHAEDLAPEALVEELNQYFEAMLEPIARHGGVVDKFIGDAIMAVWGVPQGRPDDAHAAIEAAKDMGVALDTLNQTRVIKGQKPLRQGIGLHIGEVVAGNIGTQARRQFTVIGDAVNLASRLEALTKQHKVPLIVSGAMLRAAQKSTKTPINMRSLGTVDVRGRQQAVEIFGILNAPESSPQV